MKKIYALLFILTIASGSILAQSLQLQTHSGQVIPNGGTVGVIQTLFDTTSDVSIEIDMKNISTSTQAYKVKRTIKILNSPQKSNFCFAGGCFPDTTNISPSTLTLNAGVLDNNFSSHVSPNSVAGSSLVYYKFYNIKNANDTVGIFIQSEVWHLGINDLTCSQAELGSAYPNPANEKFTVDYTLTGEQTAQLILLNMLGTKIREEPVTGGNGKIQMNVADLAEGVYFYSLYLNGKSVSTRKLLIRH
jgi:hypothetical protein